jgi:DNA-binding beta-propeller fold protein YncE
LHVAEVSEVALCSVALSNTNVAGSGDSAFADGVGTQASFFYPLDVSISPDGTFALVADCGNHRIRRVSIATGNVTTLAGSVYGYADGVGTQASFRNPRGVSISPDGTFALVADTDNNRIRRVSIATGNVTTLAGSVDGYADGVGTQASFSYPFGVSISADGTFALVADTLNHRIRRVSIATGNVTTLAGSVQGYADGVGTQASFSNPEGVSISPDGTFALVADWQNNRIRRVSIATGSVTTLNGIDVSARGISFSPASSLVLLTYPDANSLVRLSLSNACPAGSFCPQGSSIATSCAVGSYCPVASSSQLPCPSAGYVCTAAGLAAPVSCVSGYFCAPESFNVFGAIDQQGVCVSVCVCVSC